MIPEGQIAKSSRTYSATNEGDIDDVIRDVMSWLNLPNNTDWLIIFDNVDQDSQGRDADPNAYNVTSYLSADSNDATVDIILRVLYLKGSYIRVVYKCFD
jgi:hypothetical protein